MLYSTHTRTQDQLARSTTNTCDANLQWTNRAFPDVAAVLLLLLLFLDRTPRILVPPADMSETTVDQYVMRRLQVAKHGRRPLAVDKYAMNQYVYDRSAVDQYAMDQHVHRRCASDTKTSYWCYFSVVTDYCSSDIVQHTNAQRPKACCAAICQRLVPQ